MKKAILTYLVFIMTTILLGQEIKISVAPTVNKVFYPNYAAYGNKGTVKIGFSTTLDYLFFSHNKFEFGFGFGYKYGQVENVWEIHPETYSQQTVKINLLSISLKSVYNLNRDFYLSLNPTFDLNVKYDSQQTLDNQTGLGLSFGFGGKFKINDALFINIEPRLWIHNIVRFHDEKIGARLAVAGLNFGLVFGQK